MDARQRAEKIPTDVDLVATIAGIFQLVACPENGSFCSRIKTFWIEHRPLVVIAQQANLAMFNNMVQTLTRVRSVTDNIPQAEHFVDALQCDMLLHRLERLEIAVDVADNCALHRNTDLTAEIASRARRTERHPPKGCQIDSLSA